MSLIADLKILYHLAVKPVRGGNHAARMENFYRGQARAYDDFRERLLKGRKELWKLLGTPEGGSWVDLGGGTGSNLATLGRAIHRLDEVYVVDLSKSLLDVAEQRCRDRGWSNVKTVEADATTWQPPGAADVVTFSYSLTMIPDWFAAVENARKMLKPGGRIGVVDFYVSRKFPADGLSRHGWLTRSLWPIWFAADNVFPSPDHVPYLRRRFQSEHFLEQSCHVPFLLGLRVPFYVFVGRR